MLKSSSQRLFVSLGNPAHMKNCQILPKRPVFMPWLGALTVQKGRFLCLYRLQVSLELLKALNESYSPCPQLLRYSSVIPDAAAVKLAEPVCSFLLLASSSCQGHLLPALFFPVINNYLSPLPLMTSGRGSLMSL